MKTTKRRWIIWVSVLVGTSSGSLSTVRAQDPTGGSRANRIPGASSTAPVGAAATPPASTRAQSKPALSDRPEEEKGIQAIAEVFTRAYNSSDAQAVAALFTDDAEMIDEFGDRIRGRANIQAFFDSMFRERKGGTIEIARESLDFLGPDVAKEEGHTRVKFAGAAAPDAVRRYSLLFVKQGGRWRYSSVREDDEPGLAHHERLKELEWMLGDWVDETTDSTVHATCRWSPDKNFLLRDYTIHVQGKPVMTVTQRIGWDPRTKQIKSWVFDSEGGYGEGYWSRDGDQWFIKSTGVLPDGRTASATHILTRSGPQSARWASIQRSVGGQVVPNLQEYVMVRRPPNPGARDQSR
jgi:uncharacterized protein (TIGR02246 family)